MAEIISLKRARKDKARAEKGAAAAENRTRFGRTKAEKAKDAAEAQRAATHIDAHKRETEE